jgi:hypothetical protein
MILRHAGENVQLLRSARPTPLRRTPEYAYARQTSRALHLNVLTSVPRRRKTLGAHRDPVRANGIENSENKHEHASRNTKIQTALLFSILTEKPGLLM